MRDLKADLKLCEAATRGPWVCQVVEDGISPRIFVTRRFGVEVPPKFYIAFLPDMCFGDSEADAEFIAAAREGWPEAIRRAMEAEARLQELWEAADDLLCSLRASQITAAAIKQEPAVLEACRKLLDVLYNDSSGKGRNAHGT